MVGRVTTRRAGIDRVAPSKNDGRFRGQVFPLKIEEIDVAAIGALGCPGYLTEGCRTVAGW